VSPSDALHARVRAFISASLIGEPTEPFDALALALARFQAERVPAIGRLARARGIDLDAAADASAIAAVPCDVFRLARIAAHPPADDVAVFRTSGTSQGAGARGEHPFRTTETYTLAALGWGERHLWPDRRDLRALVLAPPAAEQPDSSLGFMLDLFARALGGPASFHVHLDARGEASVDHDGLAAAAAAARASGAPALVLATSFALVHVLEGRGDRDLRLPDGSRVMQTGGFKGRSREVAPAELRALVAAAFGVPEDHVVGEYGMTELSSQLYEGTLGGRDARHGVFAPPPWVRVSSVDPVSLDPLPAGEVGIARIVDLANVDSAAAIQTADRVRLVEGGVELLGRAPGAAPRGCSIAIDEMLGGR
jgi:hypothetical protein